MQRIIRMARLERCPFCGSTVHVQIGSMIPIAIVVCDNDDCAAMVSYEEGGERLHEAVKRWNRRADNETYRS